LSCSASAADDASESAWRWGRRCATCGGGTRRRRSWMARRSEGARVVVRLVVAAAGPADHVSRPRQDPRHGDDRPSGLGRTSGVGISTSADLA
jgi:hypothetical protein